MDTISKLIKKSIASNPDITCIEIAKLLNIPIHQIRYRRRKHGWSNGHWTPYLHNSMNYKISSH